MTQQKFKQNDDDSFDDAPRKKMPKYIKYLAGTAIGLVILAGAGGLIATQVIDQQKYKSMIVTKVEESTGFKIDWDGNISLGLMPLPHASINKLTVISGDIEILSVAKADIQVALTPLLSQKIDIKNITINEPIVRLTTTKNGTKTWDVKPKNQNKDIDQDTVSPSTKSTSPLELSINRIDISGGTFIIDNQQSGAKQELKNLNLTLRAESLKGPFDVKGDTEWSGQQIQIKATSGEVNIAEGSYPIQSEISIPNSGINFSFAGTIDTKNLGASGDINLDAKDLSSAIEGMTGTAPSLPDGLDGQGMIAGKMVYSPNRLAIDDLALSIGNVSYSGRISADGLVDKSVPQLTFNLSPKSKADDNAPPIVQLLSDLKIDAKASIENEKIQIAYANLKTMGNDVSIKGFSSLGANPSVDLNITASEMNLDSLSKKLSSSKSEVKNQGAVTSNAVSKEFGFTVPFSGRLRADIGKLTTGAKTYSNIKADVVSSGGALTISNAEVTLPENASINVNGKIGNTKYFSGLNLKVTAKTSDTEKLMTAYHMPMPKLSKKIGAANMNGSFSGDLNDLGFNTTISALQFDITGQGNVKNVMGTPDISSLKFTLQHPNFNTAMKTFQDGFDGSSGFSGPMDISGQMAWGGDKVDVTALSGKLGQTSLAGNISAITQPKVKISGALDFGNIMLPSATNNGGTVTASPKAVAYQASGGERWSRDPIELGWMRTFDADLDIKAKSITQNMWKLTDANFDFKLNDGVLTLNDVSAGLFDGRASINGVIKSGADAQSPISISAKLNANNVDAQKLMSAATGKVSYTLTGNLSNLDVNVSSTGASPAALVQALSGEGSINGKNIIVKGIDAAQLADAAKGSYKPLERAGSLFQSFQNGQTEFTDFNSEFLIQNGVVNFSQINFDGPKATLSSTGNVNLPKWTVDLKNSMTVKDTDIPPFDFSIRGSLDNPINSGGDIVNNYLQKKLEKKATKFIEDKLGGKLNKLLGVPETQEAPVIAPVEGSGTPPSEPPPPQQPNIKEEAAKEAIKALEGIFAR